MHTFYIKRVVDIVQSTNDICNELQRLRGKGMQSLYLFRQDNLRSNIFAIYMYYIHSRYALMMVTLKYKLVSLTISVRKSQEEKSSK